jgi:hypothetical protein
LIIDSFTQASHDLTKTYSYQSDFGFYAGHGPAVFLIVRKERRNSDFLYFERVAHVLNV